MTAAPGRPGPVRLEEDRTPPGPPETGGRRRRTRRPVPWLAVVTFVLATFALMPRPLLGLRTFGAVDLLERSTPYRESLGRPPDVRSWFQTDQVEGFPQEIAFWRELRAGRFQSWSHRVAGGTPTGIFPFNGTLSPLSIGFLFLPAWYALTLSAALALLVAQAGTYLFLRRLGVRGSVAVLGAVAYAFSGANVVNLHRVTAPFVLPLLLWAVDRLVDRPSWSRAAGVGFLVAWTWLEGFPFAFLVCTGTALAWGLWRAGRQWWRAGPRRTPLELFRRAAPVGAGVAWGVAAGVFSIVPTLWEISRRGTLDLRDYSDVHLDPIQFLGVFQGRMLGRWQESLWTGDPYPSEALTTVGLIVGAAVLLACVAAVRGRLSLTGAGSDGWAFWIVTVVVLATMVFFGTPLLTLAERLPGIAHNRIGRARFLLPLGLVVMASLWLDARLPAPGGERGHRAHRGLAALVLGAGSVALVVVVPQWVAKGHRLGQLRPTVGPVLVDVGITVAAVALVVVAFRRGRVAAPVVLALAALLWVQLAWPVRETTPAAPIADFYRSTAAHRALDELLGLRYRFAASGLFPYYSGSSQVLGLNDLRGFALRTDAARDLVTAAAPRAFGRDNLKVVAQAGEWDLASPVLDDLAVRYFVVGSEEMPLGTVRAVDEAADRWLAVTDPALATASVPAPGPITGIAVPLRADPSCSGRRLFVRLHSAGRELGGASRPAYDATGSFTVFAIDGAQLVAGQSYRLSVDDPGPGCRVEVGVVDNPDGPVPARWEIAPDPAVPVRLVSATDGWLYERPTAQPLVRAHSRWRGFPDRPALLEWLARRPPDDAGVAGYVGPPQDQPSGPALEPTVDEVRWRPQSVELVVRGGARSLAVLAENADPGWSVEVDGRSAELVRVDGALQGVFVPAGRHRVSFSYRQPVLARSALLSAAAAAAMAGAALAPLMSRRSRPGP